MTTLRLTPPPAARKLGLPVAAGLAAVGVAGGFLAWWLASRVVFVIPPPADTLMALRTNLGNPLYVRHLAATAQASVVGAAIGTGIGLLVGVALGRSAAARGVFQPLILGLYALPKVLLYPLAIPVLGIGAASKVFMGALFAVFPMIIIVASAVASAPPVYFKLGRSLQASRWQLLTRIVLPSVRVPIVTGLRVGLSLAILGVILAEFFATELGVGRAIRRSYEVGFYEDLFATVVIVTGAAALCTIALWRLERRLSGDETAVTPP